MDTIKIKIKVTKKVLEKTKHCSDKPSENCAIAYAIRKLLPEVTVGKFRITRTIKFIDVESIKLPEIARSFIRDFDFFSSNQRVNMSPIEFEIDLPLDWLENTSLGQAKEIISKSETLELV